MAPIGSRSGGWPAAPASSVCPPGASGTVWARARSPYRAAWTRCAGPGGCVTAPILTPPFDTWLEPRHRSPPPGAPRYLRLNGLAYIPRRTLAIPADPRGLRGFIEGCSSDGGDVVGHTEHGGTRRNALMAELGTVLTGRTWLDAQTRPAHRLSRIAPEQVAALEGTGAVGDRSLDPMAGPERQAAGARAGPGTGGDHRPSYRGCHAARRTGRARSRRGGARPGDRGAGRGRLDGADPGGGVCPRAVNRIATDPGTALAIARHAGRLRGAQPTATGVRRCHRKAREGSYSTPRAPMRS